MLRIIRPSEILLLHSRLENMASKSLLLEKIELGSHVLFILPPEATGSRSNAYLGVDQASHPFQPGLHMISGIYAFLTGRFVSSTLSVHLGVSGPINAE